MKKLLSILSSLMLVATSSTAVVSCSIGKHVNESIDPVLEQQNFKVLNKLSNSNSSKPMTIGDVIGNSKNLFFNNGFDNDNKYISPNDDSLTGSLDSNKWSLVDMLNSKFDLGLKRNATPKNFDDSSTAKSYGDLEDNYINWNIDNYVHLANITFDNATGSYQEGGKAPVKTDDADRTAKDAFNNLINLGNTSFWEEKGTPAWQKQVDFLKGSEFVNRTYTKNTTLKSDSGKTFTFVQLIMLQNVGVIRDKDSGNDKPNIDNLVESLENQYDNYFSKLPNEEDPWLTKDDFMNLIFSKLNIFTAQKQEYSVSVQLDVNNLWKQLNDAKNNADKIINDYINEHNQLVLGKFLIDQINTWSKTNDHPYGWQGDAAAGDASAKAVSLKELEDKLDFSALDNDSLAKNDLLSKFDLGSTKAEIKSNLENWELISSYTTSGNNPETLTPKFSADSTISKIRNTKLPTTANTNLADGLADNEKVDVAKVNGILNDMVKKINTVPFNSKLNIKDNGAVSFADIYLQKVSTPKTSLADDDTPSDKPRQRRWNLPDIQNVDWSKLKDIKSK